MESSQFWTVIGLLGGVATDESCARLEAHLEATGDTGGFAAEVARRVEGLVRGCRWPRELSGDSVEWIAAAVIASGPEAYERVLASGVVAPDEWAWDEAEILLVVGAFDGEDDTAAGPPPDHGSPTAPLHVTLQWLAASPDGVVTPHDEEPEMLIDLGDDPALGRTPVHDPDWVAAQEVLSRDAELLARRVALGADLVLTVRPYASTEVARATRHPLLDGARPVTEAEVWRFDQDRATVVLCVPATAFADGESRVPTYVEAVRELITAAEDAG